MLDHYSARVFTGIKANQEGKAVKGWRGNQGHHRRICRRPDCDAPRTRSPDKADPEPAPEVREVDDTRAVNPEVVDFDMAFDYFPRRAQLQPAPHMPWDELISVPMLVGC